MGKYQVTMPDPYQAFPRPKTSPKQWDRWGSEAPTLAALAAIQRAVYRLSLESPRAEKAQEHSGEIRGLRLALELVALEEMEVQQTEGEDEE